MTNTAHGKVELYVTTDTDLRFEEFVRKFNIDTLVAAYLELVQADGSVHKMNIADILKLVWHEFETEEKATE